MARAPKVWWHAQKRVWCSEIGGRRRTLAKGRGAKAAAKMKLKQLVEEQALLASVKGPVTIAALCELFLDNAEQHLEQSTYSSYAYACQKLVDEFDPREAHTIEPLDIERFATALKKTLNDTSRAIVLRTVQRCFNWAVEARLIPAHRLGRIRKPRSAMRDRYLTDDEFRVLLRATNPRNHHRLGAGFRRVLLALDWTMCRPGEIARLSWEHVHWNNDVAILPHHKTKRTGKPKIIPLVPKMKRLLAWLRTSPQSSEGPGLCGVSGRRPSARTVKGRCGATGMSRSGCRCHQLHFPRTGLR